MRIKALLAIVVCLVSNLTLLAQEKKSEIYFGVAPTAYKGDLHESYQNWSMVFFAGLKFNRNHKLNGNFTLSIGSVSGQNPNYSFDDGSLPSPAPNHFFTSKVVGLNYELHYNFIHKEKIKVFVSQGVGVLRFNPKDEFDEPLIDQLSTRSTNETYGNISMMLPTQLGVLYTLPNDYSIGLQVGFQNTTSDYLDNISNWGLKKGSDNIFTYRFEIHIPLAI